MGIGVRISIMTVFFSILFFEQSIMSLTPEGVAPVLSFFRTVLRRKKNGGVFSLLYHWLCDVIIQHKKRFFRLNQWVFVFLLEYIIKIRKMRKKWQSVEGHVCLSFVIDLHRFDDSWTVRCSIRTKRKEKCENERKRKTTSTIRVECIWEPHFSIVPANETQHRAIANE